ncbi:MAG: hypothetical protein K2O10_04095 [Muribaculaceae bacterium]|nr:hypothetical protein [Muribaculaceae bacterium]
MSKTLTEPTGHHTRQPHCHTRAKAWRIVACITAWLAATLAAGAQTGQHPVPRHGNPAANLPDSIEIGQPIPPGVNADVIEERIAQAGDSLTVVPVDTVPVLTAGEALGLARQQQQAQADSVAAKAMTDEWEPRDIEFSPDPTRAVWMSALFPGLGQIYNRRYWKLPIIVGGYLGLAYATSWNNTMLSDYTRAYRDLLDNDPDTRSYMDLFAPNVNEADLDKSWLQRLLQSRKNYFRRNRDLCIIGMVGVYLLAMVDAYVDASLSHFDISPQLSMDVAPALIRESRDGHPSIGLVWALNF